MSNLEFIARSQVDRLRQLRDRTTTELQLSLHRAMSPDDVRKTMLKEAPVLEALRRFEFDGADPHELRMDAAAVEALEGDAQRIAYRRLFPSLDVGVYLANHAVGKPSIVARAAMDQFYAQHATFGVDAFVESDWFDVVDDARHLVGELCGDLGLQKGDVAWFPNVSDGLSAVLAGLSGRLVTTEAHFTTGHYVHERWAQRGGGTVVTVRQDEDECVPTQRVIDALTPDTAVVSLSQVHWRSGFVHDLPAICAAMAARCPDAALVLDAYQGLGTVPLHASGFPDRTAVLGGGVKQLHAGTGAGFAWVSHALLQEIRTERIGWWAHEDPMAFAPAPIRLGPGAAVLRTGTPALLPIVLLATELKLLAATADGTVTGGVARARAITRDLMERAVARCEDLDLRVVGPRDPDRRAAFLAVRVQDGPKVMEKAGQAGVVVDFRADNGGDVGVVRLSGSAAHFWYEIDFALRILASAH
jgi:kynureninase